MLLLFRVEGKTDEGWETIKVVRPAYQETKKVTKKVRRLFFFTKDVTDMVPVDPDDAIASAYARALSFAARRGGDYKKVRIKSTRRIDDRLFHRVVREG